MRVPTSLVIACFALVAAACGGSAGETNTPVVALGSSTRAASPPVASVPAGSTPAATFATTGTPAGDPTELAAAQQLGQLGTFVLTAVDVPFGFTIRTNQPAPKTDAARAESGIPKLALFLDRSSLQGGWAALFTREQPVSGLSSIVFAFTDAADAATMIDTFATLTAEDYPAAIAVERVPADPIGEASVFTRYRISGGRTLELTWRQGRLVGQVILRYSGDQEQPDDVAAIVALAKKQAARMAAAQQ